MKQTYNLDDPSLNTLQLLLQYKLSKDQVSRFIKRHLHLKVVIRRRINSIRMDGTLKPVLEAWFNAYQDIVREFKIKEKNTYNMDETGFLISTMELTRIIIDSTLRTKH